MEWNETRAEGVRAYSNHRHWVPWCGYCYVYYSHEHTDMDGNLDRWAMATNLPDPKFDTDDDDGDGLFEEQEVTVLNQDFPATDRYYIFHSIFKRAGPGNSGVVQETPHVSANNILTGEYDTYRYEPNHETLDYGISISSISGDLPASNGSSVGEPYSSTLPTGQFPIHIWGIEGTSVLNVGLSHSVQDSSELSTYADWARVFPASELRKVGVEKALTVVTFNQPVSPETVDGLLRQADEFSVEAVKATYVDTRNPDPATNVWTLQTWIEEGRRYTEELNDLATSTSDSYEPSPHLELQGIVAITVWLPLDAVDLANSHQLVYLADSSPSYLRLIVSGTQEAETIRSRSSDSKLLEDGIDSFIVPSFNDLYPELRLFEATP